MLIHKQFLLPYSLVYNSLQITILIFILTSYITILLPPRIIQVSLSSSSIEINNFCCTLFLCLFLTPFEMPLTKIPFLVNWNCLYNEAIYAIRSIRLLDQTIELTLHNAQVVDFEYMSPRWIELTLYLHSNNFGKPTFNMWDGVRFQTVMYELMKMYKAPTNKAPAQSGSEQNERVPTPPWRGIPA